MAIDFSKLLKKGKGVPPPTAGPGPAMMEPGGGADTGDVPATPPPPSGGMQALLAGAGATPPPPARKAKPAKRGKRGY